MLLSHLWVMTSHGWPTTTHGGHMRVARGAHQRRHGLSGVHIHASCVDVLAGLARVHDCSGVANRWLHCPLWWDDASASKKLVDGGAEVGYLGGLKGPVV